MKPSVQGSPLQRPIHVKRTDHVLIRPDKSHANNMRVRRPLPPRRPYSRVLISQLQTTSENSFGSKVHPAARSSILGHRVSGNAIRSGGVPALVHAGKICRRRQGCVFHSARPRQLWKTLSQHLAFGATINGNARDATRAPTQARSARRPSGRLLDCPLHHLRNGKILSKRWGPPQASTIASLWMRSSRTGSRFGLFITLLPGFGGPTCARSEVGGRFPIC